MFAIKTEREAKEIRLVSAVIEALFGKIGERVGSHVEYGEGLVVVLAVFRVGAVATVEENDEAAVGRNGGGRREIVGTARVARDFAEQAAVGKGGRRIWSLAGETGSEGGQQETQEN
jgi:hypothetical protein